MIAADFANPRSAPRRMIFPTLQLRRRVAIFGVKFDESGIGDNYHGDPVQRPTRTLVTCGLFHGGTTKPGADNIRHANSERPIIRRLVPGC